LNIDPHDYTVFLIDWYSLPDFQFHVYTNRSNPDPDTGTTRGSACLSRMCAHGAAHSSHWSMLNMPSGTPAISTSRQMERHCGSSW
jgi:hypothetical protein